MAGFNVNQAENYGGQGGGGFFSLKNDKDVATVHILYDGVEDVTGYSVHEVELNGKKRYVNCLREYGDPVDACPFCKAGKFTQVKYFVPLFVESIKTNAGDVRVVGAMQTWERGKQFGSKLSSICSRYPNVVSHTFEIERNGKAGDQHTTYEVYETGETGATMDDYEVPNPLGTLILDKTAEEMETYLATGDFGGSAPVRRDSSAQGGNGGYTRRTPASGNGREKVF